jgi:hypothetical protein
MPTGFASKTRRPPANEVLSYRKVILKRANLKAIEKNALLDERIIERQVKTFLDIVILAMLNGWSCTATKF